MAKTSLEQFNFMIDTHFPEVKKYIIKQNYRTIVLEDHESNYTIGSNEDLKPLFDFPTKFPIKKTSVFYNEKHSYFTINIELI